MFTMPEIICDVFSFFDKDQIERVQLVNQFWNNVIIRHKNILPLRQFYYLDLNEKQILLSETEPYLYEDSYIIKVDGTNLSKCEKNVSPRYSQLTVDEVLTNLNDVVFDYIIIQYCGTERRLDNLLNKNKLVTTKTGVRFLGRRGESYEERLDSKLVEIFSNHLKIDWILLEIVKKGEV